MIIIFRPFKAGDAITAAGQSGTVEEIGIFCTLLTTADNQRIIIPNASITGGIIVNTSALPTRRVDLLFTVSFTDNLAVAKQTIEAVLKQEARLLADPAASVGVERLTDNGVELFARPWVKSAGY
jgi:small conductance mechanosensitive channel